MKRFHLFFILGLSGFIVDLVSKRWALAALSPGAPVQWLWDNYLGLQLKFNYGAAFSFGENSTWIFTIIGVCAAFMIPPFVNSSKAVTTMLALMWAGVLGNLADRLFCGPFGRGPVTDFIVYSSWFTGNVADIFLVLGAIGLILIALKKAMPGGD